MFRCSCIQGRCRIFTAGLDIDFKQSGGALLGSPSDTDDGDADPGRRAVALDRSIKLAQDSVSAVERCRKPVIVVVDGACIGGGVDLICACDIRYVEVLLQFFLHCNIPLICR